MRAKFIFKDQNLQVKLWPFGAKIQIFKHCGLMFVFATFHQLAIGGQDN